jgi:hypothetical protein
MQRNHAAARLDADTLARLDRVAHAMAADVPGGRPVRTQATRAAIVMGLPLLEARYGLQAEARGAEGSADGASAAVAQPRRAKPVARPKVKVRGTRKRTVRGR